MKVLGDPAFRNESGNPYNALLYRRLESLGVEIEEYTPDRLAAGGFAIWHLHWPEAVLGRSTFNEARKRVQSQIANFEAARKVGTRIVWTTHNVRSHERRYPWLESLFWRTFIPYVDGFISPSRAARDAALTTFPGLQDVPGFVVPHGHYRDVYPPPVPRAEARDRLAIPKHKSVLLHFGLIRPYKNVPALLDAFREWRDPDAILMIAGKAHWPGLEDELHRRAAEDPRVRLELQHIPSDELHLYLSAADLVVLPYRDILNSGSALLALSMDRPVLVPPLGAVLELQEALGTEWVGTYQGNISAAVLEEGLRWARETPRVEPAPLGVFDWGPLAEQTLEAYEAIRETGSRNLGLLRRFSRGPTPFDLA